MVETHFIDVIIFNVIRDLEDDKLGTVESLKFEICPNSAAVSDNLKILHISAVFIFGQYQYSVPGNVFFLQILDY